ncbi:unnamed protein product [Tetraodon nigroviridis]|uniref:(spotted green pufferfish) hypothetical protein n=1 Tax=Tetraodon nigroviridis TaxID=99883 RepID=Q4TAF7_TETNG|nr:unnamed protein product [Tetraodon nigroviridis]
MFAKLKKKIAEEAATAPRSSVRIPRTISKESITSMGADSGDDFASDGSSSRDDLPAQLLRRNDQIRRLEAKLSDYAEQLRVMQRTKDKLELALEKHQDSSIKKLQEQNESHQVNRTRMAESMAVALEKKDQEWMEKMAVVEKEKTALSAQIEEMMDQSLALFQKRDDLDELEGFQQQELAKVKHMLLKKEEQLSQQEHQLQQKEAALHSAKRNLSEVQGSLQVLKQRHEESSRLNAELEIEREELLLLKEESDSKVRSLERQCGDLQSAIQQLSEDFHKRTVSALESSLQALQSGHDSLRLQQQKADVVVEEKERVLAELQKKAVSLERRLQGNLSQDEHLQELLQEKSSLEESLEESRAELLALRTNHADSVGSLEAQVSRLNCTITELQTLLRHKDDSSRAYRSRTDAQIADLEQQLLDTGKVLKKSEQQGADKQQLLDKLVSEAQRLATRSAARTTFLLGTPFTPETQTLVQKEIKAASQDPSNEGRSREEENVTTTSGVQRRFTWSSRVRRRSPNSSRAWPSWRQKDERCGTPWLIWSSRRWRQTQPGDTRVKNCNRSGRSWKSSKPRTKSSPRFWRNWRTEKKWNHRCEPSVGSLSELRHRSSSSSQEHWQASLLQLQEEAERQRALQEQTVLEKDSQLDSVKAELLSQTQQLDSCQARVSYLEVEVETLTEQLQSPEVCVDAENGSVTVNDLDHIQKVNRELEQQLGDKNRTIKQLQQRLAELKRTLQKELKLKPDPDPEGKERPSESRADRQEKACLDPPPASSPPTSTIMVTNSVDLNDSREINFEYLKHVVLKFMSSREAEVSSQSSFFRKGARQPLTGPCCPPLLGLPADPGRVCAAQLHPGGGGHAEADSGVQDVLVWIQTFSEGDHPTVGLRRLHTLELMMA